MKIDMSNLISVSDVSKNTSATIAKAAAGITQIVLNHNKPAAYLISAAAYEQMLSQLEDAALTKIVKARQGGKSVKVNIEDL